MNCPNCNKLLTEVFGHPSGASWECDECGFTAIDTDKKVPTLYAWLMQSKAGGESIPTVPAYLNGEPAVMPLVTGQLKLALVMEEIVRRLADSVEFEIILKEFTYSKNIKTIKPKEKS